MEVKTIEEFEEIFNNLNSAELVIFKYSSSCPISRRAEFEFEDFIKNKKDDENYKIIRVNVISARPLSMHIAEKFNIKHESPQLIWLAKDGTTKHTASHYSIDSDDLNKLI